MAPKPVSFSQHYGARVSIRALSKPTRPRKIEDPLKLYRSNAGKFIKYFESRDVEEKKSILEDIFECEFVNKKVINWFDKNAIDLMREVSFR